MPSERVQRQIDRLLDEAEEAVRANDWSLARQRPQAALDLDPENPDAPEVLAGADRAQAREAGSAASVISQVALPATPAAAASQPTTFANGRYIVSRFLGEGGKKKVYLARDSLLDRDVAFALIKTEGLDEASRTRITREAQAMGRLGDHPNIVTVYDIGEESGAPYMVLPVLAGGDVEGVIEKAPEHRMPLEQALKIAIETCKGLEFAHGRGIVHRDLKPGNVWLSEDGTAKIGDFGLAVATDRSRLTQAGMMVGTVSYMPPEQAMGGVVGPKSDLYSLGAMLYEMVCGRPPFVGDESVAIIGQHLNTPPVAPTWHRPECPPALETLILGLLEKDPSKRPASATEVREALGNVSPGLVQASLEPSIATAAPGSGDNPLYRRTFVGRENEVKQLQAAFDAALSGHGGLVMVVGEPGIGKTALCEQLATYVALRGGKALVGHCYEEGSLSLPYLAFVEAMRTYVLAREPDGLRSDLGTGAADVARIVSEVHDRVQEVELRPAADPEDDRWRLLQAITSFLRNASTVQPLCIVLEDLHWADHGTLDLLLHVSRNLQGARLLIVGTYRDVEVDRTHRLSGTVADLRRGADFQRVPLRGLTVDEVHRMYEAIRGQSVAWAQANQVHRQTEGNPLFVQEVLRYLVEEGLVVREDGRWVLAEGSGAGMPEGLRDVVGKRLSRLSAASNRVLSIAAVIGRDFDLATLRVVAGLGEDELLSAIEEPVRVGVLEERSLPGAVRYRFAHAFFRQTLYEEIIAPRRLRLHQEIARTLEEQYSSRRQEHAAELSDHFAQSTDAADLRKAVEYGELAAQRAMAVFDYGEAARLIERTIAVQDVVAPADVRQKCDLFLALGEALQPAGLARQANVEAEKAWALAWAASDRERAFAAIQLGVQALFRSGSLLISTTDDYQRWLRRIEVFGPSSPSERVHSNFARAVYAFFHDFPRLAPLLREALSIAKEVNDPKLLFLASLLITSLSGAPEDEAWRVEVVRESVTWPRQGVSNRAVAVHLGFGGINLLSTGHLAEAEDLWQQERELATHTHEPSALLVELLTKALEAMMRTSPQACLDVMDVTVAKAIEFDAEVLARMYEGAVSFTSLLHLGRYAEARDVLYKPTQVLQPPSPTGWIRPFEALLSALSGDENQASALLAEYMEAKRKGESTWLPALTSYLQAAILLRRSDIVGQLADELLPVTSSAFFLFDVTAPARHIADAMRIMGRFPESRRYYGEAIQVCEHIGFRPETALTRLSLAELLLEHFPEEHAIAIEHLDFAIAELRDMKMQPGLERALRHRGLLKA